MISFDTNLLVYSLNAQACPFCPCAADQSNYLASMWTLNEAKAKFSDVADLAINDGPQEISIASKEPVVLIRKADLDKLTPGGVQAFFDRAPKLDELANVLEEFERE